LTRREVIWEQKQPLSLELSRVASEQVRGFVLAASSGLSGLMERDYHSVHQMSERSTRFERWLRIKGESEHQVTFKEGIK